MCVLLKFCYDVIVYYNVRVQIKKKKKKSQIEEEKSA